MLWLGSLGLGALGRMGKMKCSGALRGWQSYRIEARVSARLPIRKHLVGILGMIFFFTLTMTPKEDSTLMTVTLFRFHPQDSVCTTSLGPVCGSRSAYR
jgi:hypothetical protein